MIALLQRYHGFPIVTPPRIHTDLLWDLGLIFSGITGFYFLLIFLLRQRISRRREKVLARKKELAPMISNFLFFRQDEDHGQREDYIRMKIEIRQLLKIPINREVLSEVLMDLRKDVTGEVRVRLLKLYQDLGLHRDAYRKLNSRRWEKVSQGILELTEMGVDQAYHIIKKRVNDKRSIIRKQAQLAIVKLREDGIRYFLDTARYRISEWQQLKLMEILRNRDDFRPPRFKDWLISENEDVVLFALRLIRHYKQGDASGAIITLLQHRSPEIQSAALECIREYGYQEARIPLKHHFERASAEIKVLILDAFLAVATPEDVPWLQARALRDPSFLVRGKAGSVINTLVPGTVLPTKDIQPTPAPMEDPEETGFPSGNTALRADREEFAEKPKETSAPAEGPGFLHPDLPGTPQLGPQYENHVPAPNTDLVTDPGHLPVEAWSEEHERIFAHCVMEELSDILSCQNIQETFPEVSLDFLPVVVDKTLKTNPMKPNQPIPDWLLKLEVQAEILTADSGYVKVLREILLEDLAETEQVFSTDFIPWVTEGGVLRKEDQVPADEAVPEKDLDPEFGVIVSDIQQLSRLPEAEAPSSRPRDTPEDPEGEMSYFSIFKEFFRSYDRESKLILLDELPEIGTDKELHFLEELFEDPDEKVADRARKVYALLAKRLGLPGDALVNKGSRSLWTPSGTSGGKKAKKEAGETTGQAGFGNEKEEEFSFTPDFDFLGQEAPVVTKKAKPTSHRRRFRLFGFLKADQRKRDE